MKTTEKTSSSIWNAAQIKALRQHLKLSQAGMAQRLGIRQQTVSEWETGQYEPRGASVAMLEILAERATTPYQAISSPLLRALDGRRTAGPKKNTSSPP